MTNWLKTVGLIGAMLTTGCNSGSEGSSPPVVEKDQPIQTLTLRQAFYPDNFAGELQANINYFVDGVGVSPAAKIPYDHIMVKPDGVSPSTYTNTTAIALYLNILVEMQQAGDSLALARLEDVLSQLEQAPNWNGLFYWLYQLDGAQLSVPTNGVVSAVDNGNLSFSLAALSGAFYDSSNPQLEQLAIRADQLLAVQVRGWGRLYDSQKGLLRAGWDHATKQYLPYYIDRKANESRLAVIWAVLSTQGAATVVPESAFSNMELVTGQYNRDGSYFEPMLTWDGSYFQAMLPALWLDERQLIPDYQMMVDFSEVHKRYADTHQIPFITASATVNDGYKAYGLEAVSESYRRYGNSIEQSPTGSPHALALYRLIDNDDAIDRLLAVKSQHPAIETTAGWFDAVNEHGNLSSKIIGIDQGMFVGAFMVDGVRANVTRYMARQGYQPQLDAMYSRFVAQQSLPDTP